ncbi:hypothetical protein BK011_07855 [Tenericutes bacterium MZ-XQ]|nr:hypothetical protein BK011_07855 [Tenericutes bacterium MZ-XQ]
MLKFSKLYWELSYKKLVSYVFLYPIMMLLIQFDSSGLEVESLSFSSLHLFGILIIIMTQNTAFRINKYLAQNNYKLIVNKLPTPMNSWIRSFMIFIILFSLLTLIIACGYIWILIDGVQLRWEIINMIFFSNLIASTLSIAIIYLHTLLKTSDYLVVNYILLFFGLMTPLLMITIGKILKLEVVTRLPYRITEISWIPISLSFSVLVIIIMYGCEMKKV